MKKFFGLLLSVFISLCLVACGTNETISTNTLSGVLQVSTSGSQAGTIEPNGYTQGSDPTDDASSDVSQTETTNSQTDTTITTETNSDTQGTTSADNENTTETNTSGDISQTDATNSQTETTNTTHTHSYSKQVVAPTCTEKGYTKYTCSCGNTYVGNLVNPAHSYSKTVTEPTCTEKGYTTYTCSCGDSYITDYVSPSHKYVDYVCTVCGHNPVPQGYTAISTPEQLSNLRMDGKYILMCDIDMIQTNWAPIGTTAKPFTGVFDGNGYCIKNLRSSYSFFGVNAGEIKNLGLENLTIIGSGTIGGLVRENQGTVRFCYVTGKISATSYVCQVGGLVGVNSGTISDCYAICDVTSTATENSLSEVGGLVGFSNGEITNCYASGKIKGSSEEYTTLAGGLVGQSSTMIKNCFATGTVFSSAKKSSHAGGIIGLGNWKGTNCWYGGIKFTVKKGYSYTYDTTNVYGAEINVETLKTIKFQQETLGWSSDIWNFIEGQYPTLRTSN